jgi:replicative DNA helicase
MVELQILSRVLKDKNLSLLTLNNITDDYFITYQSEYEFIRDHVQKYGNVPDKETFLAKFPDFTVVEVAETDKYLIDTFNEEHLYAKAVPVVNKIAELMQTDANAAIEYLGSQLENLRVRSAVIGTDIISQARKRYEEYEEMRSNPEKFQIATGFHQLDNIIGGWRRGEELVVMFARTGQGKSWLLIKSLQHAWRLGYRVGLIEPEMSDVKTGYRFDTLYGHMSNRSMVRGEDLPDYGAYISDLEKRETPFFVVSPKEFNRRITVSKLRSFIQTNNIDILGIDGISYLTDERMRRGDNRTSQLTNISEDLMDLSIELKVPIIVVAQSNREGAKDDEAPGLENIRDSDGIAYNCSVAISARQKDSKMELNVRKNRNGVTGDKLSYLWDIDTGNFTFVENEDDEERPAQKSASLDDSDTPPWSSQSAPEYRDGTEVF